MNVKTKDTLRLIAEIGSNVITGFLSSFASILRMFLFSKISVAIETKKNIDIKKHIGCTILANGPSLKSAIENNELELENVDIFCVNSFCESEYFWKIKPMNYFLIDGQFFNPTVERCKNQVDILVKSLNKVDWDINLFIPSHAINGGVLKGLDNNRIHIVKMNTTTIEGYDWFCNLLYSSYLGMPMCINVVIFAIMTAINMKYESIFMYGIDHSFSAQLFVDEENCVCSRESHVYSTEARIFKLPETTMAQTLLDMSNAFRIHEKLEKYSKKIGVKIINCTKGSFVDAYERNK